MAKKHKTVVTKSVENTDGYSMWKADNDERLEALLEKYSDKKVSFAKIIFNKNRGPYIVAFPDSTTRDYCECNALDFKPVTAGDIKTEEVPIWECGAKTPEEINALPKLNIKKHKEKALKDKEARKAARAAKMIATKKKKVKK